MMKKYENQMIRRDIKLLLNSMVFPRLQESPRIQAAHTQAPTHVRIHTNRKAITPFIPIWPIFFSTLFTHLSNGGSIFRFILKLRWAIVREYFSNLFCLLFCLSSDGHAMCSQTHIHPPEDSHTYGCLRAVKYLTREALAIYLYQIKYPQNIIKWWI